MFVTGKESLLVSDRVCLPGQDSDGSRTPPPTLPETGSRTPDIHVMLGPRFDRFGSMPRSAMSPHPLSRTPRASTAGAVDPQLPAGEQESNEGGDGLDKQISLADAWGEEASRLPQSTWARGSHSRGGDGAQRAASARLPTDRPVGEVARIREQLRSANGESREGRHEAATELLEQSLISINSTADLSRCVSPRAHSNLEALRANSILAAASKDGQLSELKKARKAASNAVALDRSNPRAYFSLARAERQEGHLAGSARAIYAALQREPCNAEYAQGADETADCIRFSRFYRNELRPPAVHYRRRDDDPRPPTPEPEPAPEPEKKGLDDAWKYLDVFDIFDAQQDLRAAILRVLDDASYDRDGDGEGDGKVSSRDKMTILNFLKRSTTPKKDIKRIEDVLGDDGLLSQPAKELLQSLMPPDVAEDWANIVKLFDSEQGFFRTVFRYYAVEGAVGMSDIDTMGVQQWSGFCRECKIKLGSKTEIDRIFIRSNRDNSDEILKIDKGESAEDSELLRYLQPGRENWKRDDPINSKAMNVPEFVAALVRCAVVKYPGMPSICDRFETLFKEYIQNNACMSTDADAVMDAMGSAELKGVLRDKGEDLEEIFDALRMQHNTVRNASPPTPPPPPGPDLHFGLARLTARLRRTTTMRCRRAPSTWMRTWSSC